MGNYTTQGMNLAVGMNVLMNYEYFAHAGIGQIVMYDANKLHPWIVELNQSGFTSRIPFKRSELQPIDIGADGGEYV